MTLTLILLLFAAYAVRASTRQRARHLAVIARPGMPTRIVILLRNARHVLRASTLQQDQLLVLIVHQARTMTIRTRQQRVKLAPLGTTLHQGLPAARSVQRVSKTLTLILQLHAWTVR